MKKIILALGVASVLALAGCQGETTSKADNAPSPQAASAHQSTSGSSATSNDKKTDARLGAVLIYADWCGSCKILDPKIKAIKAKNEFAKTEFITLDFTDKDRKAFFKAAREAGVAMAVREQLGEKVKTGQMFLIDLDDKKVVGVLKKDMSEAEMVTAINAAAAGA